MNYPQIADPYNSVSVFADLRKFKVRKNDWVRNRKSTNYKSANNQKILGQQIENPQNVKIA